MVDPFSLKETLVEIIGSAEATADALARVSNTIRELYAAGHGAARAAYQSIRTALLYVGFGAWMLGSVVRRITTPLVNSFQQSIIYFQQFEWELARVVAITGATSEEVDNLADTFKRLGRETIWTSSQAAEAGRVLALAGFQAQEVVEALPGVLDLAAIELIDVSQAARVAANILRGLNAEAEDMTAVLQAMTVAATHSATTLSELGDAAKYISPIFEELNLSIAEMFAQLEVLANAGIRAGNAGRYLRMGWIRMAKAGAIGTETAMTQKEAMEALGLSWDKFRNSAYPSIEMIEYLAQALEGLTEEQKLAYLQALVGTRASTAWLRMIDEGADSLRKQAQTIDVAIVKYRLMERYGTNAFSVLVDLLKHAKGGAYTYEELAESMGMTNEEVEALNRLTLQFNTALMDEAELVERLSKLWEDARTSAEIARIQLRTLRGAFLQLKASIQEASISIYQAWMPATTEVIYGLRNIINAIASLPTPLRAAIGAVMMLGAAVGVLGGAFIYLVGSSALILSSLVELYKRAGIVGKQMTFLEALIVGTFAATANAVRDFAATLKLAERSTAACYAVINRFPRLTGIFAATDILIRFKLIEMGAIKTTGGLIVANTLLGKTYLFLAGTVSTAAKAFITFFAITWKIWAIIGAVLLIWYSLEEAWMRSDAVKELAGDFVELFKAVGGLVKLLLSPVWQAFITSLKVIVELLTRLIIGIATVYQYMKGVFVPVPAAAAPARPAAPTTTVTSQVINVTVRDNTYRDPERMAKDIRRELYRLQVMST